jgi:dephospho-CoA kinase
MYLVGLTGGIAAGKSTVADFWTRQGAIEVDADALAREAVAPGTPGAAKILELFGSSVFNPDGTLNRPALGELVFNDREKREQLEAIVHPIVKALAKERVAAFPEDSIVVYNVPLLVEASVDLPFDLVVTVEAPIEKQLDRLVKIRGLSQQEAAARIASQASPAQRANVADVILNSNQDLILLLKDAELLWHRIEREASAKFSA